MYYKLFPSIMYNALANVHWKHWLSIIKWANKAEVMHTFFN